MKSERYRHSIYKYQILNQFIYLSVISSTENYKFEPHSSISDTANFVGGPSDPRYFI